MQQQLKALQFSDTRLAQLILILFLGRSSRRARRTSVGAAPGAPATPATFIFNGRWTMYFGISRDILHLRKLSAVRIYCRNKPAVGCARKPRLQATWFMKLGLGANTHGHWVITVIVYIVSDFSLSSVVAKEAVTLYCN